MINYSIYTSYISSKTMSCLFLCFKNVFEKIKYFLFFSLLQINIFLVFSDHFDVLMSKIIFKN
jgi:hypothetical protein